MAAAETKYVRWQVASANRYIMFVGFHERLVLKGNRRDNDVVFIQDETSYSVVLASVVYRGL